MSWNDLPPDFRQLAETILSPRELEIMRLLASNATQRQIASLLNISRSNVRTHRDRALDKLAAHLKGAA